MSPRTLLVTLPLLLPLTGCVVAAVAAGATYGIIRYDKNQAVHDLQHPASRVWRAAQEALVGRGYRLPGGMHRDLPESEDRAELHGDGYWVQVEEQVGGWTRLRVRVGKFDSKENRRRAGLLVESIEGRLGGRR